MPNDPRELWFPGRIMGIHSMSYKEWQSRYCTIRRGYSFGRSYDIIVSGRNLAELEGMFKQSMLRREQLEVLGDLPPLRVDTQYVDVTDDNIRLKIRDASRDTFSSMDDDKRKAALKIIGLLKAEIIARVVLDELKRGEYQKVVLMAHHLDVIDILVKKLWVCDTRTITGSVSQGARARAVDDFTNDPECRVLVVQQKAGGTGLNLQVAHEIVLVEPDWSPDTNRQAIKRIHRIGQDHPCRARLFVVNGTRDEAVMASVKRKMQMQEEAGL